MSDEKVVSLRGGPVPEADVPAFGLVEEFDALRADIATGKLKAFCFAGVRTDGGISYVSVWGSGANALPLLGAVNFAQSSLFQAIDQCVDDESGEAS